MIVGASEISRNVDVLLHINIVNNNVVNVKSPPISQIINFVLY